MIGNQDSIHQVQKIPKTTQSSDAQQLVLYFLIGKLNYS